MLTAPCSLVTRRPGRSRAGHQSIRLRPSSHRLRIPAAVKPHLTTTSSWPPARLPTAAASLASPRNLRLPGKCFTFFQEGRFNWIATIEYWATVKAPQQHSNAADKGSKAKIGWNKMQVLKPSTHINKSSGNFAAKCRKAAGFLPSQSDTETEIAYKTGILTKTPSKGSKKLSSWPPSHSGKIKLQLFPIDETIQKILQQEKHNPYLELILAPRKKISSVVQHLNTKWGNAQCAKGELMLFPNDARLDSVAVSEKWSIKDPCTAADVHAAVGSPSTFRLRYGWFGPNLEQQISESSLESALVVGSTSINNSSDLLFSEQKQMVASSGFPSNFVKPSAVDNTNTVQAGDNQSKVASLSWLDCISNISFGALLSEAAPSQDSKQLPSQINLGPQQIPVTCDSFDAAIASLIARQQGNNQMRSSNPSLWEAEETCHAFSFQNQTSKRTSNSAPGNSSGTATASVLGAIPEMGTDDDQQCSIKSGEEELNTQTPLPSNDHNAKPEVSMHGSTGDLEIGSSCCRLLGGTDSLGLTELLTNSMDAFQNFSIF